MISKNEAKIWVKKIDSIITVFPQQVISKIITTFLISDFEFNTALIPCNTHTIDHCSFDVKNYINVYEQKLVTKKYREEWICVPLVPKLNLKEHELKLHLQVTNYQISFFFAQNPTSYGTFILTNTASFPLTLALPKALVYPGEWIFTTKYCDDYDILFATKLDKSKQTPEYIDCYKYKKGTIQSCDTILIGVGYYKQMVQILTCPLDTDPIWNKIENWPDKYVKSSHSQDLIRHYNCAKCLKAAADVLL